MQIFFQVKTFLHMSSPCLQNMETLQLKDVVSLTCRLRYEREGLYDVKNRSPGSRRSLDLFDLINYIAPLELYHILW